MLHYRLLCEHDLIDGNYIAILLVHTLKIPSSRCPAFLLLQRVPRRPLLGDPDLLLLDLILEVDSAEDADGHDSGLEPPVEQGAALAQGQTSLVLEALHGGQVLQLLLGGHELGVAAAPIDVAGGLLWFVIAN